MAGGIRKFQSNKRLRFEQARRAGKVYAMVFVKDMGGKRRRTGKNDPQGRSAGNV